MNRIFIIPVGIFILLVVVLGTGLILDPNPTPALVTEKLLPIFALPDLKNQNKTFTNHDLVGKVWLVNVWASWCVSCRTEHPLLMQIAHSGKISLFGLNYQDQPADARNWLEKMGNPYQLVGADITGEVASQWGVRGTPTNFIVDQQGTIRFEQIGPLNPDLLQNEILPLIEHLQGKPAS